MNGRALSVVKDEALALAHVRRLTPFCHHALQCRGRARVGSDEHIASSGYCWVLWVALMGLCPCGSRPPAFNKMSFPTAAWGRRQVEKYMGRKSSRFFAECRPIRRLRPTVTKATPQTSNNGAPSSPSLPIDRTSG